MEKIIINNYIQNNSSPYEQRDTTLKWRGSTNQRIWHNRNGVWIDVTDTI